jgi:general secretion pathway protein A
VVWHLPPYASRVIKPGLESDPDKWLNSNILKIKTSQIKALGSTGPIERKRSENVSTKDNVRWFQQEVGLKPDGVAGSLTLIHINNLINHNVPVLLSAQDHTVPPKS